MPKLASFVHVQDPEHGFAVLGPDDEVPDWALPHLTNPKAWAEPPANLAEKGYESLKVDDLKDEIARRNKRRVESDRIEVGGAGNKPDLIAALVADDDK